MGQFEKGVLVGVGALCFVSNRFGKDLSSAVCLVTWPFNENEAGDDLVLIETLPFFLCKLLLISMRTASLT